jgi:hypothetical protein
MLQRLSLRPSYTWMKSSRSLKAKRRKRKGLEEQLVQISLNCAKSSPSIRRKYSRRRIELRSLLLPINLGKWIKNLSNPLHKRSSTSPFLTMRLGRHYSSTICKKKAPSYLTASRWQRSPMSLKDTLAATYLLCDIVPLGNKQSGDWEATDTDELGHVHSSFTDQLIYRSSLQPAVHLHWGVR